LSLPIVPDEQKRAGTVHTDTSRAGTYLLQWSEPDTPSRVVRFAVNPAPEESDLTRLTEEALVGLCGRLAPVVIHQERGGLELARAGHEIWRTLAWMVLVLLLSESLLAGWIGRKR
jgi:hypothetical protein